MIKRSSVLIALLYVASAFAADVKVAPFVTDGCTGYVEGTMRHPGLWHECCVEHDFRYWVGGTRELFDAADLRLKECVKEKGANGHAKLMYFGVRLGHHSPFRIKGMQWGNGLGETGMDRKLTNEEVDAFITATENTTLVNKELKSEFLLYLKKN